MSVRRRPKSVKRCNGGTTSANGTKQLNSGPYGPLAARQLQKQQKANDVRAEGT